MREEDVGLLHCYLERGLHGLFPPLPVFWVNIKVSVSIMLQMHSVECAPG